LMLKSVGAEQLSQRSLQVQTAIGRKPGTALTLFLEFVRSELKQKDESIRAAFDF